MKHVSVAETKYKTKHNTSIGLAENNKSKSSTHNSMEITKFQNLKSYSKENRISH